MSKARATYRPSDIYEKWVDQFLEDNPDCWTVHSKSTHRKREFIYKSKDIKLAKNKRDQGKEVITIMSFARWLKIIKVYYLSARKEVIAGKAVRLGHRLGRIRARTISRNFKKKSINWHETKKYPLIPDPDAPHKLKREKVVYFNSDKYSRIAWERLKSIPNEATYKFVPSGGTKQRGGFKQEFKTALKDNPALASQYKQFINELI